MLEIKVWPSICNSIFKVNIFIMEANRYMRFLVVTGFVIILSSLASCSVTVSAPVPVVVVHGQVQHQHCYKKPHGHHHYGKHHGHHKHHR